MFFQLCTCTQRVFLSACVCFRVQYIYRVCFSLSYSCISFSAEVWNQLLAMQLHPLVGRRPVHQRTIIAYPSPLVAQEGRMREKICLRALQKTTARPYHDDVDGVSREWSAQSLKNCETSEKTVDVGKSINGFILSCCCFPPPRHPALLATSTLSLSLTHCLSLILLAPSAFFPSLLTAW